MRNEIIETLQRMIQALVAKPVVIGSIPPLDGYAISFAGGAPIETYRNLTTNEELPVVLNGKGENQEVVAAEMNRIHKALTTSKILPFSTRWQIYAIETSSAPQLIGREENKNWVYGSSFRMKFFAKEEKNG